MTWVLESDWGKLGDYGGSFQPLTCLDNLVQTKTSKITLAKTIPHVSPCSPLRGRLALAAIQPRPSRHALGHVEW
jgi:hypothetical protein